MISWNDPSLPPWKKPEFWVGLISALVLAGMTLSAATPETPGPHVHVPAWVYGVLFVIGAGLQFVGSYFGGPVKAEKPLGADEVAIKMIDSVRSIDPFVLAKAAFLLAPKDRSSLATLFRSIASGIDAAEVPTPIPPPDKR